MAKIQAGDRIIQTGLGPGTAQTDESNCRVYVQFDNPEVGSLWRYTQRWYCPDCEEQAEKAGFLVRPEERK